MLSAKFNFHWQLGYEVENPFKVTKGTRMVVTAHHDNSANNPSSPAPDQDAMWGEMTSQEMMLPWFGVIVDRAAQLTRSLLTARATSMVLCHARQVPARDRQCQLFKGRSSARIKKICGCGFLAQIS